MIVAETCRSLTNDVFVWFDTLAILPFWLELVLSHIWPEASGNHLLKLMKALRMLRLLKIARSYDGSIVIVQALKRSGAALGVPFFFLAVGVIVTATFVFYLEDDAGCREPRDRIMASAKAVPAFSSVTAIWFMP